MRELYRKGMAGADLALNLIVAKGAGAALGANSAAADVITSETMGWLTGMEVVSDTVQREIAQGHTNEDALALGIIRGAIAKLGQSYSINRLLRQPELLVQSGGAGAEWTRQVAGLIESGDKAVIANSARALMRRGYSGEEALALALMPEQPGSFLISGFRALAQNGEIQRDILLSRIAPRIYRDAQATGKSLNNLVPAATPRSRESAVLDFLRNAMDRDEKFVERNDIASDSEEYIQIGKSVGAKAGNYDIINGFGYRREVPVC